MGFPPVKVRVELTKDQPFDTARPNFSRQITPAARAAGRQGGNSGADNILSGFGEAGVTADQKPRRFSPCTLYADPGSLGDDLVNHYFV